MYTTPSPSRASVDTHSANAPRLGLENDIILIIGDVDAHTSIDALASKSSSASASLPSPTRARLVRGVIGLSAFANKENGDDAIGADASSLDYARAKKRMKGNIRQSFHSPFRSFIPRARARSFARDRRKGENARRTASSSPIAPRARSGVRSIARSRARATTPTPTSSPSSHSSSRIRIRARDDRRRVAMRARASRASDANAPEGLSTLDDDDDDARSRSSDRPIARAIA